ncbi:MAG: hypothetical protein GY754_10855 [bacterium]|nr:hypothetical protein [bacterium]
MKKTTSSRDFVRDICMITSSKVTPTFGQAEKKVEGNPIIMHVRAKESENLKKGDKAFVLKYNKTENVYWVTRFDYEDINLKKDD